MNDVLINNFLQIVKKNKMFPPADIAFGAVASFFLLTGTATQKTGTNNNKMSLDDEQRMYRKKTCNHDYVHETYFACKLNKNL
jgi:hypothetical protein